MTGGNISGNSASNIVMSGGGGVHIAGGSSFTMTGGSISRNSASNGGGVYISGSFSKSGSSIIYGGDALASLRNYASYYGHAVFWDDKGTYYFRNATLGEGDNMSTSDYPLPATSGHTIGYWTRR